MKGEGQGTERRNTPKNLYNLNFGDAPSVAMERSSTSTCKFRIRENMERQRIQSMRRPRGIWIDCRAGGVAGQQERLDKRALV